MVKCHCALQENKKSDKDDSGKTRQLAFNGSLWWRSAWLVSMILSAMDVDYGARAGIYPQDRYSPQSKATNLPEPVIVRRLALTINPKKDLKAPHLGREHGSVQLPRFDGIWNGRTFAAPPSSGRISLPTSRQGRQTNCGLIHACVWLFFHLSNTITTVVSITSVADFLPPSYTLASQDHESTLAAGQALLHSVWLCLPDLLYLGRACGSVTQEPNFLLLAPLSCLKLSGHANRR